ncbi:transporter substrate-binding domain-containing protein [Pseudodesulfovibrio sp. zrk46]|uniref:substrate-binding periplasmic protein n=1 Tax=Pseudodesulfovibrio sp. zrk46 TaxID=2725288 RepID=UPI001449D5CF|nr:transporter substrate-binding domain-containing protein [Pseudodesulfovibrio sp. zrk46]QJB55566.1 transporter substrate-binding domain-containing protein [Pseudodesulfovibrio sp. zrk46]
MLTRYTIYTLLFAVFLLCPSAQAEEIVVTNGEWPPYTSKEFKHGGYATRICTQAFAIGGMDVRYMWMPWKRGYESARSGPAMGTFTWNKTREGEKHFYYSDPVFAPQTVIFHTRGSSFDWWTPDDFGHLRVGATLGYLYEDELRKAVNRHGGKLEIAPTDEINFQKLAAGRIDVFPCAKEVGLYLMRHKLPPGSADTINYHPRLLLEATAYLLISKRIHNGPDIIKRFNEGLQILRDSGKYDEYHFESLRGEYMPQ